MSSICTPNQLPICQLTVNTDISGIGVRLSFYLQSFLLVILVDRSWQDAPSALWTFIATSFGLTVSAINQARTRELSFFQALQVTNLVWLANFGTFLALASFSRHRKHENMREEENAHGKKRPKGKHLPKIFTSWTSYTMKIAATCQTFFTMVLTLFTWAHQDTFPAQTQWSCSNSTVTAGASCNTGPVKYVAFFAIDFNAETSGKRLGLIMSGILTAAYVAITVHELGSYVQHQRRSLRAATEAHLEEQIELVQDPVQNPAEYKDLPALPQVVVTGAPSVDQYNVSVLPADGSSGSSISHSSNRRPPSPLPLPIQSLSPSPPHTPSPSALDRPKRPGPHKHKRDVDPMFLGILFASAVLVYFVATTELLNTRNPVAAGSNQWAFGQILALILIVPSLVAVVQAFQEHGIERIHHRLAKNFRKPPHTRRRDGSSATSDLPV